MDDTDNPLVKVDHRPQTIQMKRTISLVHCVAILFALTGHVSVFTTPKSILQYSRKRRDVTTWRVAKRRYQGVENKPLICIAV